MTDIIDMVNKNSSLSQSGVIEESIQNATGTDIRQPVEGAMPVLWMARAGSTMPLWWSPMRDIKLSQFWKRSDHLSGAIYTMEAKMTSIDFRVEARDSSVKRHVQEAEYTTELLRLSAEFGDGWVAFFARWIEEYVTQDNGAFAEVIGAGDPAGPIVGAPMSLRHLDSARCQRTGDPIYPVIYTDLNGKRYKMHFTRIIMASQMTSPRREMFGVGFCGVSRAINIAQTMIDILSYKQEKLGSRPHRAIVITKGGLDPEDVRVAFQMAEADMDSQGLSRYSKIVIAGDATMPEADMKLVELSSLPDGFDERTSMELGMATIALALGMDARELFPAAGSGATRADALLQHLKQRGKAPGQILQVMEHQINYKFLPPHLKMVFDFQDDAQDRQTAEIKKVRADARSVEISSGSVNTRTARMHMADSNDITRTQFEMMELEDGRLQDGTPILSLFYSNDADIKQMLDLGVDDPLTLDVETAKLLVKEKLPEIYDIMANTKSTEKKHKATQAYYALINLVKQIQQDQQVLPGVPKQDTEDTEEDGEDTKKPEKPDNRQLRADRRVRTEAGENVSENDMQMREEDQEDEKLYAEQPL